MQIQKEVHFLSRGWENKMFEAGEKKTGIEQSRPRLTSSIILRPPS